MQQAFRCDATNSQLQGCLQANRGLCGRQADRVQHTMRRNGSVKGAPCAAVPKMKLRQFGGIIARQKRCLFHLAYRLEFVRRSGARVLCCDRFQIQREWACNWVGAPMGVLVCQACTGW